jgi:hypothetical protein
LFDALDYLIPDQSRQVIEFVKEVIKDYILAELKRIANNDNLLNEMSELNLKSFEKEAIMHLISHKLCVKQTKRILKESRNLEEGLVRAGAEGLVGGAAMMAGSLLVKKVSDRHKLKQIEELEDQKQQLRLQMRKKEDDDVGKERLRKQIANLNARIERLRAS